MLPWAAKGWEGPTAISLINNCTLPRYVIFGLAIRSSLVRLTKKIKGELKRSKSRALSGSCRTRVCVCAHVCVFCRWHYFYYHLSNKLVNEKVNKILLYIWWVFNGGQNFTYSKLNTDSQIKLILYCATEKVYRPK